MHPDLAEALWREHLDQLHRQARLSLLRSQKPQRPASPHRAAVTAGKLLIRSGAWLIRAAIVEQA